MQTKKNARTILPENLQKKTVYSNSLAAPESIKDFVLEGKANITFSGGCMRMENALGSGEGQKANYVLWGPYIESSNIVINWEFRPLTDYGLCIMFFCARGIHNTDIFDRSLAARTGEYAQYHSGDINAFHVSYFRRKELDERRFHTCNLRKSWGGYLVAQGADPLPAAADADCFYRFAVIKNENRVSFFINDLEIFTFTDDTMSFGKPLADGRIGFRQLAPLVAEYRNLEVYEIVK